MTHFRVDSEPACSLRSMFCLVTRRDRAMFAWARLSQTLPYPATWSLHWAWQSKSWDTFWQLQLLFVHLSSFQKGQLPSHPTCQVHWLSSFGQLVAVAPEPGAPSTSCCCPSSASAPGRSPSSGGAGWSRDLGLGAMGAVGVVGRRFVARTSTLSTIWLGKGSEELHAWASALGVFLPGSG